MDVWPSTLGLFLWLCNARRKRMEEEKWKKTKRENNLLEGAGRTKREMKRVGTEGQRKSGFSYLYIFLHINKF